MQPQHPHSLICIQVRETGMAPRSVSLGCVGGFFDMLNMERCHTNLDGETYIRGTRLRVELWVPGTWGSVWPLSPPVSVLVK